MYIRTLSLTSTGSILIASQIPWLSISNSSEEDLEAIELSLKEDREEPTYTPPTTLLSDSPAPTQPQKQPENSATPESKVQTKSKKKNENMNGWSPDPFISGSEHKTTKGKYESWKIEDKNMVFSISKKPEEDIYVYSIGKEDSKKLFFSLYYETKEDEYEKYPVENINIFLFTNPAWYSESKQEDEYKTQLSREEINELFTLFPDKSKLKQLLLSLSSKRNWKAKQNKWNGKYVYESENGGWMRPNKLDNLKELKIKYFSTYQDLKTYIQNKASVCTTPKKSCIADKSELTFFDYDEYSFFNKSDGSRTR